MENEMQTIEDYSDYMGHSTVMLTELSCVSVNMEDISSTSFTKKERDY